MESWGHDEFEVPRRRLSSDVPRNAQRDKGAEETKGHWQPQRLGAAY